MVLERLRVDDSGMKQTGFASAEYAGKKKTTRRERFLGEMNAVVPWSRLEALIEPHYPKSAKVGRPPIGVPRVLRMYFPQQWYPRRQRLHRAGQARRDYWCPGRGQAA